LWGEDFMKLSEKIKRSIAGKERTLEESGEALQPITVMLMGTKEGLLSEAETNVLKNLLLDNQTSTCDITSDFSILTSITSEIKSINHQSVLLHGEKIQAAKELFSASRNCSEADKKSVIDTYDGESKETFLKAIRRAFPVERKIKRTLKKELYSKQVISLLQSALEVIEANKAAFSLEELRLIDSSTKLISKHLWED
jgi:hypothetical protein